MASRAWWFGTLVFAFTGCAHEGLKSASPQAVGTRDPTLSPGSLSAIQVLPRAAFAVSPTLDTPPSIGADQIDLSDERREYETKRLERGIGIASTIVGVLALAAASYGYATALSDQSSLRAETVPISLNTRSRLINGGRQSNAIGVTGGVVLVVGGGAGAALIGLSL